MKAPKQGLQGLKCGHCFCLACECVNVFVYACVCSLEAVDEPL